MTPDPGPAVDLIGLTKAYGTSLALADVTVSIPAGQFVALVGASGSGKSTLLKAINRLIALDAGQVMIAGQDAAARPPPLLRREIGYVFQGIGLFPHLSVEANIAAPGRAAGQAVPHARVLELLDLVGLPRGFASRLPGQLSGGQAQRVGVARALAGGASLLLMDEPFGALDPVTRSALAKEVRRLHERLALTTIMVTHDITEALLIAERIVVLDSGRIVADAAPAALLTDPGHPIAAALIAVPRDAARAIAALEAGA